MKILKPKFWDYSKPNIIAIALYPLTLLTKITNKLFLNRVLNKNIKTICIGNIYLGGTGKTPLSIHIYQILKKININVVVVRKFYKQHLDEINQYKTNNVNLVIANNRKEALEECIKQKIDWAIFDDGLQDKDLDYNLKIVCFNSDSWIGNNMLIPSGPLRESLNSLRRFDIVFFNGFSIDNEKKKEIINKINPNLPIFETEYKILNIDEHRKKKFVLFSGIGNPNSLEKMLKINNYQIEKHFIFPDHYLYKYSDLKKIEEFAKKKNLDILTTEKDKNRIDKFFNKLNFLKIELNIKNEEKFISLLKNNL